VDSLSGLLFLIMPVAGATLLAFGIFQIVTDLRSGRQRKIVDRLNESRVAKREAEVKESLLRRGVGDFKEGNVLEGILSRLQMVTNFQTVLDQADLPWRASRVLMNIFGGAAGMAVVLAVLQVKPLTILVVSGGAIALPLLWLLHKRKKRIRKLVEQLPDVFELMGQALRAGHSLASAIQLVSQQMQDPIAGEFALVFHEQNLGISIEDALLNMAERVDQMDVRFFVTAVLIQRQTGGDLAEVLDNIGQVIRDRIQLFGVVQALTAEGRLSGWVLLVLPVLCFVAMLFVNPEYASKLTGTEQGKKLLGIAITMDLMGMAMIKKIVNIKV